MPLQNINPLMHIKVTEMLIQIYISRRKQIHIAQNFSISLHLCSIQNILCHTTVWVRHCIRRPYTLNQYTSGFQPFTWWIMTRILMCKESLNICIRPCYILGISWHVLVLTWDLIRQVTSLYAPYTTWYTDCVRLK